MPMLGKLIFAFLILLFIARVAAWLVDVVISRSRWENPCEPSLDAKIMEVETKKVFFRNAFRTTVSFSDGYRYHSHKCKVEENFFSRFTPVRKYTISVELDTKVAICEDAMKAHDKAVRKKLKLPKKTADVQLEQVVISEKWSCTCGRMNTRNTSSCVCGVGKREAILTQKKNSEE